MHGAAVIPQYNIVNRPFMSVGKGRLGCVRGQFLNQFLRFCIRHSKNSPDV
jgi:hypothetical protein